MQSFLIIAKDNSLSSLYVSDFCKREKIDNFDVSIIESEKTIGIGQVREMQQKIFLKPLRSTQKAVILKADWGITTEAQNALLKILEEPPNNTIIIITTPSEEEILPTIISRCKILNLNPKKFVLENSEVLKIEKLLSELSEKGIGERLKLAEDLSKDKKETLKFLEKMIFVLRKKMTEDKNKKGHLNDLKIIQEYYKDIKNTNVNLRLALENLLLQL